MTTLAEIQRQIGVTDDGRWGPVTARAIAARLRLGETGLLRTPLSEHFELRELLVSETAARKGIPNLPDAEQLLALVRLCMNVLEPVRRHYGKPVIITSGLRSSALNRAVGGSSTSQHSLGEAADFTVASESNIEVCRWIAANCPFDQLIYEFGERGWIHASYGPRNRRHLLSAVKQRSWGRLVTAYVPGLRG